MKKLIKIMFVLLLIVTPLYSQKEVALTRINARYYNSLSETVSEFKLQINGVQRKGETFAFVYFSPTKLRYAAIFTQEKRVKLLAALKKYKEWQKIAIDNKVEHIKNIVSFPCVKNLRRLRKQKKKRCSISISDKLYKLQIVHTAWFSQAV